MIIDDVLYFAEPFFQPGIIAQAAFEVTDRGVAYFSSAGNSGRDSYEDAFRVLSGLAAANTGGDPVGIFTFTNSGTIDIDGSPGADKGFNLVLEPFSSPGGTDLRFNAAGQPLTLTLATGQPRFVAPDGASTTFFGSDLSSSFPADSDAFPNFFGTSVAAPHVAAVAALLLEKAGGSGSLFPYQLDEILQETAIEMGLEGNDLESGAGLIDAEAALNQASLGYVTFQRRGLDGETSLTSAGDDPDLDRRSNLKESFTGTNPVKADDHLPLALVKTADGSLHLRVTVSSEVEPTLGKVKTSTDLAQWTPLSLRLPPEENQLLFESDESPRFFRLTVSER